MTRILFYPLRPQIAHSARGLSAVGLSDKIANASHGANVRATRRHASLSSTPPDHMAPIRMQRQYRRRMKMPAAIAKETPTHKSSDTTYLRIHDD